MYLLRSLNLLRWQRLSNGPLTASLLSTDLRCLGNAMSFWRCQDPKDDAALHEVALALVSGTKHLNRLSLAWLPVEQLLEEGFSLHASPGRTPVADLRERHVEIQDLNAERFVRLAQLLQESVQVGNHQTLNKRRLRSLLLTAIQERRLAVHDLEFPMLTRLLGGIKGEVRLRAEQVYLHTGLDDRLRSFRAAAAWYQLNPTEKSRLGELENQVAKGLKESNRPEAAPDGVDLLRAVQEEGQPGRTLMSLLSNCVKN